MLYQYIEAPAFYIIGIMPLAGWYHLLGHNPACSQDLPCRCEKSVLIYKYT